MSDDDFSPFTSHALALTATRQKRAELFTNFGVVSPRVRLRGLAPQMSGPSWPATLMPSLVRIDAPEGTVFFTDGLSDPSDPELHPDHKMPKMGHGIEFFVALQPAVPPDPSDAPVLPRQWAEHVLWHAADAELESRARFYLGTSDHGALTMLVPTYPGLERFTIESGDLRGRVPLVVGANLRMGFRELPLPLFGMVPLSLSLLLPEEYDFAVRSGNRGGLIVANRLESAGIGFWNRMGRSSLVHAAVGA